MAKKYDESDGIWRTVGGRRIFIRNDQTLADAMKESGKFKKGQVESEIELARMKKYKKEDEERNAKAKKELTEEAKELMDDARFLDPKEEGFDEAFAELKERFADLRRKESTWQSSQSKSVEETIKQLEKEKNGNQYTSKQLKEKYGTDDVELINAGKAKEDRVSMINDENVASELRKADNWSDINKTIDNIKDEKVKTMMKKEAQKLEENENGAWKSSEYLAKQYNFYNEDSKKSNGKLVSTKLNEDEVTSYSQWKEDYGTNIAELEKDLKLSERYLDEDSEGYREAKKSLENGRKYLEDLKKADKTTKSESTNEQYNELNAQVRRRIWAEKTLNEQYKYSDRKGKQELTNNFNKELRKQNELEKKYGKISEEDFKKIRSDIYKESEEYKQKQSMNDKVRNEAYKKYKKEHPNSKMSLEEFLKK